MKTIKKAQEARKPKKIYECDDYLIEEIPLNYRATIKCKRKEKWRGIGRKHYSHPEHGLDYAREIVENIVSIYFASGQPDPDYLFED